MTYNIAVTGHRPDKLGGYDKANPIKVAVREEMGRCLQSAYDKYGPIGLITGGALGVDQMAALIGEFMNERGLIECRYIVAVPMLGQENRWPEHSQDNYRRILRAAHEEYLDEILEAHPDAKLVAKNQTWGFRHEDYPGVYVCSRGGYAGWKMNYRNTWMVDRADAVLAVWDGSSGGTANCVNYARTINKPIRFINPQELDTSRSV